MASCAKCSTGFPNSKDILVCAECKMNFHPTCTRVESLDNFKKFSTQRKSTWKCDGCATPTRSDVDHSALATMLQNMDSKLSEQISKVNQNVESVKSQLSGVNETIINMQQSLNSLMAENEKLKADYKCISEKQEAADQIISDLSARVRDLEQYSRKNNVEIVGVPYTTGENLYELIDEIVKLIDVRFDRSEISTLHRLQVTKDRPNPSIIVRFVCRDYKHLWVSKARENRKRLNGAGLSDSWESYSIYVNDHLTIHNRAILSKARKLAKERKIARVWTRDCRVYAKKTDDPQCRPTPLNTMDDLEKLLQ